MAYILKLPAAYRERFTQAEQQFIYAANQVWAHLKGKLLQQHLPEGIAAGWPTQVHLSRLRSSIEGEPIADNEHIKMLWNAYTAQVEGLKGRSADELWQLHNRLYVNVVHALHDCFMPTDEDRLAHQIKCIKPSLFVVSTAYDRQWCKWESEGGVDDIPSLIEAAATHVCLKWTDQWGRQHRDVALGPASVIFKRDDGPGLKMSIAHYEYSERARGLDNWMRKCADSNPWLRFVHEEA